MCKVKHRNIHMFPNNLVNAKSAIDKLNNTIINLKNYHRLGSSKWVFGSSFGS